MPDKPDLDEVTTDEDTGDDMTEPEGVALAHPRLLAVVPADLEQVLADLDE